MPCGGTRTRGRDCKPGRGSVGPPAFGSLRFCVLLQETYNSGTATTFESVGRPGLATPSMRSARRFLNVVAGEQTSCRTRSRLAAAPCDDHHSFDRADARCPQRVRRAAPPRDARRARKHANLNHVAALSGSLHCGHSSPELATALLPARAATASSSGCNAQWPSSRSTSTR